MDPDRAWSAAVLPRVFLADALSTPALLFPRTPPLPAARAVGSPLLCGLPAGSWRAAFRVCRRGPVATATSPHDPAAALTSILDAAATGMTTPRRLPPSPTTVRLLLPPLRSCDGGDRPDNPAAVSALPKNCEVATARPTLP